VLAPLGHTIYLSFFAWDGLLPKTWVGVDNYKEIWNTPELRDAFKHSFILIFFYAVIPTCLALLLVATLSRARIRGQAGFRTVLFLPQVIPLVVIAVIWQMIYQPNGPLNRALEAVGLGSLTRAWLGDFTWALPAVGFVGTWVMMGLALVLFMAGVQKIPQSLYDAARVDGAGAFSSFRYITLPLAWPATMTVIILSLIGGLRSFDLIWAMTRGGPGFTSDVIASVIYKQYQAGFYGLSTAGNVVLFLLVTALVVPLYTFLSRREVQL
jgi:raffinose/stachyose/melibiose transport system permease protein